MKTYSHRPPIAKLCDHGFASILTVLSTGIALLIMLVVMYQDTVQTQEDQKMSMLGDDYQQREDAFLRALVNIVPNQAMRGMQDDSYVKATRNQISWNKAIVNAYTRANVKNALPTAIAKKLKVKNMRNANTANFSEKVNKNKIIFPLNIDDPRNSTDSGNFKLQKNTLVSPGIKKYNRTISADYPARLTETKAAKYKTRNAFYPVVSNGKIYDASVDGWIGEKTKDQRFALIPLPKNHFNYKDGAEFIAKNNWWTFKVNFSEQQKGLTKFNTRDKQYIFSIYEIPAQLAINSGTETILGQHKDKSAWNNKLTITGGVFASKVQARESFSAGSVASRKNIELKDPSTPSTAPSITIGSDIYNKGNMSGNSAELQESQGLNRLISSAGNSGKVAFIPINGGEFITDKGTYSSLIEAKRSAFYDNPLLTLSTPDPPSNEPSKNAISPTSWDFYSRGACQAKMRIVFDDTQFHFSFLDESIDENKFDTNDLISFVNLQHLAGKTTITIDILQLQNKLKAKKISRITNNSLYVKYVGTSMVDTVLENAEDFSEFANGFSFINGPASNYNSTGTANSFLVIAGDTNVTNSIPLSIFSPAKRFGKYDIDNEIELTGQLSTTSSSGESYIGDLKSGSGKVNKDKISGELINITHPDQLPPINMMNWMISIREIHN